VSIHIHTNPVLAAHYLCCSLPDSLTHLITQEHLRHELGMRVSRGELRAMMGEAGYKVGTEGALSGAATPLCAKLGSEMCLEEDTHSGL
jgi:hypothetical protein